MRNSQTSFFFVENAASGRHFHGDCFGDFVFPKKNSSAAFLSPGQEEKDEEGGSVGGLGNYLTGADSFSLMTKSRQQSG